MRTPITYYGGKQMLAKLIVSLIPEHKIYCEPYFGGGAVFFAKSKSHLEVINDTNNKLITFFMVLRDDVRNLNRLVSDTLHSEAIHKAAKNIYNGRAGEVSDLELAWSVWVVTNESINGSIHGGWKWCNGTSGSHSGIFLRGKREALTESVSERVKDVQISCREALRVIEDRDSKVSFFFLDPPYPGAKQAHYSGYTMNEFFMQLQQLEKIKGKFILFNYWSQTLKYFILKNNWHTISISKKIKTRYTGSRNGRENEVMIKTEILVMNFIPQAANQYQIEFKDPNLC